MVDLFYGILSGLFLIESVFIASLWRRMGKAEVQIWAWIKAPLFWAEPEEKPEVPIPVFNEVALCAKCKIPVEGEGNKLDLQVELESGSILELNLVLCDADADA